MDSSWKGQIFILNYEVMKKPRHASWNGAAGIAHTGSTWSTYAQDLCCWQDWTRLNSAEWHYFLYRTALISPTYLQKLNAKKRKSVQYYTGLLPIAPSSSRFLENVLQFWITVIGALSISDRMVFIYISGSYVHEMPINASSKDMTKKPLDKRREGAVPLVATGRWTARLYDYGHLPTTHNKDCKLADITVNKAKIRKKLERIHRVTL